MYEDTSTTTAKNHYGYFIAKYTFVKTSTNSTEWEALKTSIEGDGLAVNCGTAIKATYTSAYNTDTEAEDTTYIIGAPAVYNVSLNEYYSIITGEGFTWEKPSSDISYIGKDLMKNIGKYAFITINTSRSIINDAYEGY